MSTRRSRRHLHAAVAALAFAGLFGASGAATAQTKWDLGAEAGAMRRVLVGRPFLANDAQLGPVFGLAAYVALSPLVSGGVYFMHDISPQGGVSTRQIYSGGLRVRFRPAWPTGRFRASLSVGLGIVGVNQPAHSELAPLDNGLQTIAVDDSSGYFIELPVGFGLSYAVAEHWRIGSELSARIGFNFNGDLYSDARTATATGQPAATVQSLGEEGISFSATLGISYQR